MKKGSLYLQKTFGKFVDFLVLIPLDQKQPLLSKSVPPHSL